LVRLLSDLENKFNGHIFSFAEEEVAILNSGVGLEDFSDLIEAKTEVSGQLSLWDLYSFRDLPVEVISHIYQLFVEDSSSSIYTPHFLVQLILDEVLSPERIERLYSNNEVILDPACGSGIFLVEAYKRLILHWRVKNNWKNPDVETLQGLLKKIHGIDLDEGAVELTAFSLCLSLCDSLQPETLRTSEGLFPTLMENTIRHSCFFKAQRNNMIDTKVGVIIGNPPFVSKLNTEDAQRSYDEYNEGDNHLPDKQVAYLFLHESMNLLNEGGIIGMLQSSNFLYNLNSKKFRQRFFKTWNVREVLDFISVRGLFAKGGADTKVVTVIAEASMPDDKTKILHATFRRSGRTKAQLAFDLDYYDLHWVPRIVSTQQEEVWQNNLLGGDRVTQYVRRLRKYPTISDYASQYGWDFGEGFIAGTSSASKEATFITGQNLLPTDGLTADGINPEKVKKTDIEFFASPRNIKRFKPPLLLIKEHMDLHHDIWLDSYLTYKARIVGFAAPKEDKERLQKLSDWISSYKPALQAFTAAYSHSLFGQKATVICADEIYALPFPEDGDLDLSENEKITVDDTINFYRDFIRFGEDKSKLELTGIVTERKLDLFSSILTKQINGIYGENPLKFISCYHWPGVICQSYVFGDGNVEWTGASELKSKLNSLLQEQIGSSLFMTRIARIYDGHFIHILKPQSVRYWLNSIALKDSDDIISDLRLQGF